MPSRGYGILCAQCHRVCSLARASGSFCVVVLFFSLLNILSCPAERPRSHSGHPKWLVQVVREIYFIHKRCREHTECTVRDRISRYKVDRYKEHRLHRFLYEHSHVFGETFNVCLAIFMRGERKFVSAFAYWHILMYVNENEINIDFLELNSIYFLFPWFLVFLIYFTLLQF